MPTVITTPGATNANSYATRAEGDTYFDSRLFSTTWTGASNDDKDRALIMSTRVLDCSYAWTNYRVDRDQALEWPRQGMLDMNQLEFIAITGANSIPPQLKNAQLELAMALLTEDRTLDSDVESKGIKSLTAGPVSLSFKDSVYAKVIPDATRSQIPLWWGWLKANTFMRAAARA